MSTQVCYNCKDEKLINEYSGRKKTCNKCLAEKQRVYYYKN